MAVRRLVPTHLEQVLADTAGERWRGSMPAAVLLFDAEGFTALSDRLRAHGTRGAEALASALNEVFAPVVDTVTRSGGFVATFTGDGVVAAFPGPADEAVPTAVSAGAAIIDRLTGLGEIATLAGPVELRLRAIVGAGTIEWLVWRTEGPVDSRSQSAAYTYLGSALAKAQRGEDLVTGDVLGIGPVAAAHLSAATVPLGHGYHRLSELGAPGGPAATADPSVETRLPASSDAALPPALRFVDPRLHSSRVKGEFRPVVSAFVKLRETPAPGSGHGPMQVALDAAARHRGYLVNVLRTGPDEHGITLLLTWGAPRGDERGVALVLRFLADLSATLGPDHYRVGATFDTVFAGFVGSPAQETYSIVGVAVNLAARLCSQAAWGEIRVDDSIARRLGPGWRAAEVGRIAYKGLTNPVPTFALEPVAAPSAEVHERRLVGRGDEVAALRRALRPVTVGEPVGIVLVTGEAGVGKSHLIAEVRAQVAAIPSAPRWVAVDAEDAHHRPFGVLEAIVRALLGAPSDAEIASRLAEVVADRIAPDDIQRLAAAIADLQGLPGAGPAAGLDPRLASSTSPTPSTTSSVRWPPSSHSSSPSRSSGSTRRRRAS